MDGDKEARVLEENEVQQFLLKYDVGAYEKFLKNWRRHKNVNC